MTSRPERRGNLWNLAAPPAIWAAHFLASYITVAIWCARTPDVDRPLSSVRITIAVVSVAAIAMVLLLGWRGWLDHRAGPSGLPHDSDSPTGRSRFLGFATFLLSCLSAVAIAFQTLPVVVLVSCR